ncbi:MAG: T9SS type A sorting domain-containing protein, partial [Bacteroidetes bacterium]|nr:T9SS type A sorting domain-containing protein [Bacteroidota bacterium]MBS1640079.1 T9SS type A sorting domain-containing protein [Bacteroidota bacterium]MBS1641024.1 T9SS type A sorting domain-containing protein [Bacteroidota bacterium]MBS1642360.1 T9SS type A sorting domain-containing protein [Bacteroidota bacterium]
LQYNNSQQAAVDVSNLATGMYVLKISNGEKTVQKKILVQH